VLSLFRLRGLFRLLIGGGFLWAGVCASVMAAATPALTINNQVFTGKSIALIHQLLQRDDPALTRDALVDRLIHNHLIAAHARTRTPSHPADPGSVGFAQPVRIDNQITSTFRALYPKQIHADLGAISKHQGPAGLLVGNTLVATEVLDMLATNPPVYQLSPDDLDRADALVVARFQLPDMPEQTITLAQLYQRQNVQGRIALHQRDHAWLENEVLLFVSQNFIHWWIAHRSDLTRADIGSIKQIVDDRIVAQAFIAEAGVSAEMHQDNHALREASQRVTQVQIARWYAENESRFRELAAVDAWHLRCPSREVCLQAHEEITRGLAFPEAVRRYSVAANAAAARPGYLGHLKRENSTRIWLHMLALMQPVGMASQPIRQPGAHSQYWEIVYTDNPVWMTHAANSPTVQSVARREIARQVLIEQFIALASRLRAQSTIVRPTS